MSTPETLPRRIHDGDDLAEVVYKLGREWARREIVIPDDDDLSQADALLDELAHEVGDRYAEVLRVWLLEEWPSSPDLPGPTDPEPLPLDALPVAVRGAVESVRDSLQVPGDLAACLALAAISTAIADRVEVQVRPGWVEAVALFLASILPPASRKSPAFARFLAWLEEKEREMDQEAGRERRKALDRVDVAEAHLARMKTEAGKGEPGAANDLEDARDALEEARRKVPPSPRIIVQDATPEALVRLMAEGGGRAAILSAEGDPLRMADGRYSSGDPRGEVLKGAWSAEPIRVDRRSADPLYIPRPTLTVALTFQPGVLESLRNARSFRGEGVFGRFLFTVPPHGLGTRLTGRNVPTPDTRAEGRFEQTLRRLLDAEPVRMEEGTRVPHRLTLAPAALDLLHAWEGEVEADLADGARLAGIRDWAGKMVGQTVRLATLLEVAERADAGRPLFNDPISARSIESAIELARAFSSHALNVFASLELDQRQADLQYLLRRLRELPEGTTETKLRAAVRGRASIDAGDRAANVAALIDDLTDRGCLRRVFQPHEGPGRPESPVLELHPVLRVQRHPINPKNPPNPARNGNKRDLRDANRGSIDDSDPLVDEVTGV